MLLENAKAPNESISNSLPVLLESYSIFHNLSPSIVHVYSFFKGAKYFERAQGVG